MAFITQLDTSTLSNQNLSAALLVHTFTNTTRKRKIYISVDVDQVAGNGAYSVYATIQRAGAGSAFRAQPTTSATVASGVTSISFESIPLVVGATDVVKVYVTGLAGDTTTPDITTYIDEEFVLADASGNVTFSNTSIATVTTLTNAPPNSAGVTTILADYARRTGDYATVAALATLQGNVTTILTDYARRTGDYATVAALATLQGNVTTILADYARRTGDYSTLTAAQVDTLLTANHGAGTWGAGGNGGTLSLIYTLLSTGAGTPPIEGATVELYAEAGMVTIIDSKITNAFGVVTFSNLVAGTYYLKRIKSGWSFTNPDSSVVA